MAPDRSGATVASVGSPLPGLPVLGLNVLAPDVLRAVAEWGRG